MARPRKPAPDPQRCSAFPKVNITPKIRLKQFSKMQLYRLVSDLTELGLPRTCTTDFPDPNDLLNFKLILCPDEVRPKYRTENYYYYCRCCYLMHTGLRAHLHLLDIRQRAATSHLVYD